MYKQLVLSVVPSQLGRRKADYLARLWLTTLALEIARKLVLRLSAGAPEIDVAIRSCMC